MQPALSDVAFDQAPFIDEPFNRSIAAAHGISDTALRAGLRRGIIRHLLRGVYVAAHLPDTIALRCAAARLVIDPQDDRDAVVIGPAAAWIHGSWQLSRHTHINISRDPTDYCGDDVVVVQGVPVSSPIRTAIDIARAKPRPEAVACLDALLRDHQLSRDDILARLAQFHRLGRRDRVHACLVLADERSASTAESLIRVAWVSSPLPTPVPAFAVRLSSSWVRLALALPTQQFGVVFGGSVDLGELSELRRQGWGIVEMSGSRVTTASQESLRSMLVGEYHQTLLRRVAAAAM